MVFKFLSMREKAMLFLVAFVLMFGLAASLMGCGAFRDVVPEEAVQRLEQMRSDEAVCNVACVAVEHFTDCAGGSPSIKEQELCNSVCTTLAVEAAVPVGDASINDSCSGLCRFVDVPKCKLRDDYRRLPVLVKNAQCVRECSALISQARAMK